MVNALTARKSSPESSRRVPHPRIPVSKQASTPETFLKIYINLFKYTYFNTYKELQKPFARQEKTGILGYWDNENLVEWKNLRTFALRNKKRSKMIQTHLMKLEPPYPVLNMKGMIVRHVATLIEVHTDIDRKTGEEKIKTHSRPVVDFGDNHYAGVVYEEEELEECEILTSPISLVEFHMMVHDRQRMFNPGVLSQKPDSIVYRLAKFGIDVEFPKKVDEDGFETNEPADVIKIGISLGKGEDGYWHAESRLHDFCFDAKDFESSKALLNYIRDMRSSYYKAFSDHQFDIVFFNNMPETKPLLDELNANPHL